LCFYCLNSRHRISKCTYNQGKPCGIKIVSDTNTHFCTSNKKFQYLGLKDQIIMTGLGFAKNPKRPENEWTPKGKLIKGKMTLHFVSLGSNKGYYTCKIPRKGEGPDLVTNMNEFIARQSRTNAQAYLSKKGTSLDEVNSKLQDHVDKGYIEMIDTKKILKELTVTFSVIFQW
jgi:hypothetical protein